MEVIHGSSQAIWVPIEYAAGAMTIYVGAPVSVDEDDADGKDGIQVLAVAAGAANVDNGDVPIGVCIGTNLRKPLFNSTAKTEYITTSSPHDSTSEFVLTGGPYIGGGREAFAKIDVIDPCTVLRSKLVDSSMSGAPAVSTLTTGCGGDGVDSIGSACSVATIQGFSTMYVRTGANKGAYRILDGSASTTDFYWDTPMYADMAVDDTVVVVNVLPFGPSQVQLLATYSTAFDIDEACTSDYFFIDVLQLNLAEQYKEYVDFRWNASNFMLPEGARD